MAMTDTDPRRVLVDATSPITRTIQERHRVGAVQCSPTRCVGARCLLEIRGVLDARVGTGSARILRKDGWHRYDLHPDTAAAIRAYDEAGEGLPAGFHFKLIPPRKRLGGRAGEKPGTNRRSGQRSSVATRRESTRSLFVEPAPGRRSRGQAKP
jgi:hypothetical protein